MIADIWTIVWKEWKEFLLAQSDRRGGLLRLALMVGVFGVFLPLQTGREWVTSPMVLVYWAWVPLFLVVGMIADAFAGERERHTLETLLASRMPNRPILLGKVLAAVGYGWGLTVLSLLLGLLVVNVAHGQGRPLMYPLLVIGAGLPLGILTAGLASSVGVLISLRAATARQAAQTMSMLMMVLFVVPVVGLRALPATSQARVLGLLAGLDLTMVLFGVGAVLVAANMVLLAVAMARFQRARLILD